MKGRARIKVKPTEPTFEEFRAETVKHMLRMADGAAEFPGTETGSDILETVYDDCIVSLRHKEITIDEFLGRFAENAGVSLGLTYIWEKAPDKTADEPSFEEFRDKTAFRAYDMLKNEKNPPYSWNIVEYFEEQGDVDRLLREMYSRRIAELRAGKLTRPEFMDGCIGEAAELVRPMYIRKADKEEQDFEQFLSKVKKHLEEAGGVELADITDDKEWRGIIHSEFSAGRIDIWDGTLTWEELMTVRTNIAAFCLEMVWGADRFTEVVNKSGEQIPTYEEFRFEVEKYLIAMLRAAATPDDIRKYLSAGEGAHVVKHRYIGYLREFLEGELTRLIFLGDCTVSVGYCLEWMYTPPDF